MSNLEYPLGTTWLIPASIDIDDMAGATFEWRLRRHGEDVLTRTTGGGITVLDAEDKTILITVPVGIQTSAEVGAGLHEYRLIATKAGDVIDQADGILYVRDNP
jgi:hypothetical protein